MGNLMESFTDAGQTGTAFTPILMYVKLGISATENRNP